MKKRVLIWISLSSCVGRQICRGVYQYTRLHAPDWEVLHTEPGLCPLKSLPAWGLDGLMGPFGRSDYAPLAKKAAPVCINLHGGAPFNNLPQAGVNDRAIGETAAAYLLRLGFESFGYFGFNGMRFSDDRWLGYQQKIAEQGKQATLFTSPHLICKPAPASGFEGKIRPALKKWICEQPRPFALFVMDDMRTSMIYDICRESRLTIPDDVALLSVNNDDIYCDRHNPALSSIEIPSAAVGYRAAQMMYHYFKHGKVPEKQKLFDPGNVVERASTLSLRLNDRQVVNALRFIAQNAARGISSDEIAKAAGLSRRVLEKRFRTLLNCSPQAEVRRAQIERVKIALRDTNLSLEEISEATGFTSGNYLSQIFKKITGQTPGAYRRSFR
jgi:LacI family transcriptional regulator